MSLRKNFFLLATLSVFTLPLQGHTSTMVVGCCSSTGAIASPQEVSLAASNATAEVNANTTTQSTKIQNVITKVGKLIGNEIQKNRSSNEKLIEEQVNQIHDMLVEYGTAQANLKAQETYISGATMDNNCARESLAAKIQAGNLAEKKVTNKLSGDLKTYNKNFSNAKDRTEAIGERDDEDIDIENLIPSEGTFEPEEVIKAQDMSQLITNPYPDLQITDDEKNTEAGYKYDALQKVKTAQLSVPQEVFNKSIAAYSPSIDASDEAMEIYTNMGLSGDGSEVGIVDGMISPYALLKLQVQSRYGNANWYTNLAEKNQVGILKELTTMEAVGLEIKRRQLELSQLMALMMAQETTSNIHEDMKTTVNNLYTELKQTQ